VKGGTDPYITNLNKGIGWGGKVETGVARGNSTKLLRLPTKSGEIQEHTVAKQFELQWGHPQPTQANKPMSLLVGAKN